MPLEMTLEHLLQHVENPGVSLEIETPITDSKEPDPVSVPKSGPWVNLCTVFANLSPAPKTIVVDSKEEEVHEVAGPAKEKEPVQLNEDPVETKEGSEELALPLLGKQ